MTRSLEQHEIPPEQTNVSEDGTLFLDFGKAAFGTLRLPPGPDVWVVHLGEQLNGEGRVERSPAGSIRYIRIQQPATSGGGPTRVLIPPDTRNTGPAAVRMPEEIGEVFPFRYAEIESAQDVDPAEVRQIRVQYPFDDEASAFSSSDPTLNAVWDLCKYTIKATTFCGVYVDGDRERIPYEGDAYINQLCHYAVDREYEFARHSHEYLLQNPTWPTEWLMSSVMMAWADLLYTGDPASAEKFYKDLCVKTLVGLAREDGLISVASEKCTPAFEKSLHLHGPRYIADHGLRDLVDWPPGSFTDGGTGERDNHEMLPINTVVNAYHAHVLKLMSRIADVLGKSEDGQRFRSQAARVEQTLNTLLFDSERGVYIDGEGSAHSSLHSNLFMLAFDLVPDDRKASVVAFVKSRGMACSVYAAQFLLEALYRNGEEDYALELMTARHNRSWWNMIRVGSTMTLEAWDLKYKNNLDWNHAWGAAPANILSRFVLGVQPLEPGFTNIRICPRPGSLKQVSGKVPTPRGPIFVSYADKGKGERWLRVEIPDAIQAEIGLPVDPVHPFSLEMDGADVRGESKEGGWFAEGRVTGTRTLILKENSRPGE